MGAGAGPSELILPRCSTMACHCIAFRTIYFHIYDGLGLCKASRP